MQSQTRLVWIGLIVAIAFGLTIEVLKSTRLAKGDASWRPSIFGMQDFEDSGDNLNPRHQTAKSADQAQRARARLLRGRIAGLGDTKASVTPAVAPTVAATPIPVLPILSAQTPVNANDAKKKADDAKKKKKKKKKKSATEATPEQINQDTSPGSGSSPDKSASTSGGFHGAGAGGSTQSQLLLGGVAPLNENPQTLLEWKTYILREPSYERTMKLVEAQQNHGIDSEIFHEVVSEMLADSREKMHEYAILALGSSPGLESFLLLQAAAQAQSVDSPLRLQARNYLRAYSKLENLRYLGSVIATETESATAFEALRLIQIAVSVYKAKPASQPSPRPGTLALVARQFTPLVSILNRVAATSKDGSLRQEASRTVNDINNLIGTVNGPAV